MIERVTKIHNEGLTFDVFDTGPIDGEPIVLLHGFPQRSTEWDGVTPLLHEHGFRTIAIDQRGYSPGARPRRRRDYTLPKLVGDVVALIDTVCHAPGGRVHLVGHDWGAVVAWGVAMQHPERLRSLTAVQVGHPAAFSRAMVRSDQALKSWYIAFFNLPFVPEWAIKRQAAFMDLQLRKGGMTDDDVVRFRKEIVDDGALTTALHWYRGMPLTNPRFIRRVRGVPTTLVWSTKDVALGRYQAEHTADFVDAPYELVVMDGASHWLPTEAAEPLVEVIVERAVSA